MRRKSDARSKTLYETSLREVQQRKSAKSELDAKRSDTHYTDVQASRERRIQTASRNWKDNEKRVTSLMTGFNDKIQGSS